LTEPRLVMTVVRLVAFAFFVVLVIFAITSPVQSTLTRYTRLLLLPISTRTLHLVEVGAAAADPWVVLAAPGLLAFAAGIASGGRLQAALVIAAASVLFLATLACLGAAISFAVAWLFRSRRRGEMLTLVFVLGLSLVSILPAMFSREMRQRRMAERAAGQSRTERQVNSLNRMLAFTRGLPSQLYGDAVSGAIDANARAAGLALAALSGEAALFFLASGAIHRRLVASPEGVASKRGGRRARPLPTALPLVAPATAAIAIAQFRSALRTVRGRLIVLMPGPLLALLVMAFRNVPDELPFGPTLAAHGHLLLGAGIIFSIYAMQAFSMNLFGADRAGLTLQFLSPVSDVQLARGKILGTGLMLGVTVVICVLMAAIASPSGSPLLWLAVLIGGLATYLWLTPMMVWLSALFPLASDLSKTGSGGNPHPVPMLAGTALTALAALPAALIVVGFDFWLKRPLLALPAMIVWVVLAWLVTTPLVRLAARTIGLRRENLALVAQAR
jgi:hypothetical protein